MNTQLFDDLCKLIQQHAKSGQDSVTIINTIRNSLCDLEQQARKANGCADELKVKVRRLPDPPRPDEMISPPCDLPRTGTGFESKTNWSAKRLPRKHYLEETRLNELAR